MLFPSLSIKPDGRPRIFLPFVLYAISHTLFDLIRTLVPSAKVASAISSETPCPTL